MLYKLNLALISNLTKNQVKLLAARKPCGVNLKYMFTRDDYQGRELGQSLVGRMVIL